jgi:hypothetical protein
MILKNNVMGLDVEKIVASIISVVICWGLTIAAGFLMAYLIETNSTTLFTVCFLYLMLPLGCGSLLLPIMCLCFVTYRTVAMDVDVDVESNRSKETEETALIN